MEQVSKAWELLLMLGAGTGLVFILRWYWWRINAWSEVSAMASAFVVSVTLRAVGRTVPAFDTAARRGSRSSSSPPPIVRRSSGWPRRS